MILIVLYLLYLTLQKDAGTINAGDGSHRHDIIPFELPLLLIKTAAFGKWELNKQITTTPFTTSNPQTVSEFWLHALPAPWINQTQIRLAQQFISLGRLPEYSTQSGTAAINVHECRRATVCVFGGHCSKRVLAHICAQRVSLLTRPR